MGKILGLPAERVSMSKCLLIAVILSISSLAQAPRWSAELPGDRQMAAVRVDRLETEREVCFIARSSSGNGANPTIFCLKKDK